MRAKVDTSRHRFGRVSVYRHHGANWLYWRDDQKPYRRAAGGNLLAAECEASLLNAKLAAAESGFSIDPLLQSIFSGSKSSALSTVAGPSGVTVDELRQRFLHQHEKVLHSSLATVSRYSAATLHLANFAGDQKLQSAADVYALQYMEYLRGLEISPNGHRNTARRKLRDKGVVYILECCRSMYHFGIRHSILPKDLVNPFTAIGLAQVRIRDSKQIFVFSPDQELAFFNAASPWAFAIHFVLAKTGLRPGELVHLLIEDVDLAGGWLHVRGKPDLGWTTKTTTERRIPLIQEAMEVLRRAIGNRHAGVVFIRIKLAKDRAPVSAADRSALAGIVSNRISHARAEHGRSLTRREEASICRRVWREAGAIDADEIRVSFIRAAKKAGLSATCPKSWRHTFATMMQAANVDVLVRQETLGHRPAAPEMSALGMTGVYTHTSPEFQRSEIHRAMQLRLQSLALVPHKLSQEPNHE